MNASQKKHLKERIERVIRNRRRAAEEVSSLETAPPEIIEAEKKVDDWIEEREKEMTQERRRIQDLHTELEEELLFGDPQEALAKLKKVEEEENGN